MNFQLKHWPGPDRVVRISYSKNLDGYSWSLIGNRKIPAIFPRGFNDTAIRSSIVSANQAPLVIFATAIILLDLINSVTFFESFSNRISLSLGNLWNFSQLWKSRYWHATFFLWILYGRSFFHIWNFFFFFGGLKLKRDKKMKDSIILCEFNSF